MNVATNVQLMKTLVFYWSVINVDFFVVILTAVIHLLRESQKEIGFAYIVKEKREEQRGEKEGQLVFFSHKPITKKKKIKNQKKLDLEE